MTTLNDLKEYLRKNVDEVEFLELLDITTEELLEVFADKIEEKFIYLVAKLELEDIKDESDGTNNFTDSDFDS